MNRSLDASVDGWDEARIDARTGEMVEALLATWPVPAGHVGTVVHRAPAHPTDVSLRDLVAAGVLEPGTLLLARPGPWGPVESRVLASGELELDGKTDGSPSGAARIVRQRGVNGWMFWRLPDGRRLGDPRGSSLSTLSSATVFVEPTSRSEPGAYRLR